MSRQAVKKLATVRTIMLEGRLTASQKETLVAAYLMGYRDDGSVVTQGDIAVRLGTTRQAVNRHLGVAGRVTPELLYSIFSNRVVGVTKMLHPKPTKGLPCGCARHPIITEAARLEDAGPPRDGAHVVFWKIHDMMAGTFQVE